MIDSSKKAYQQGLVKYSAVTMHFILDGSSARRVIMDQGPVFFRYPVVIREEDNAETLGARVNKIEHGWQSWVTNLVVSGQISWDGRNEESLRVPSWYRFHHWPKNFRSY